MDLPADPDEAAVHLAASEAQSRSVEQALQEAPTRLEEFVDRMQATGGVVSFAAGEGLPPAESELLEWLDAVQPDEISFGLGIPSTAGLQREGQQLQAAMGTLLQQALNFAWVETRREGRLMARTSVNWTGDAKTVWGAPVTLAESDLHRRSLRLAVVSRASLMRMLVVVTQGAAKISVLIATPGGAVLALPAAWKYVKRLLREIETYRSSTSQIEENLNAK